MEKIKIPAPKNKTMTLSEEEKNRYTHNLITLNKQATFEEILDKTIHQDLFHVLDWLPENSVDLLFADPPYNLNKHFNTNSFSKLSLEDYEQWLDSWIAKTVRLLKPHASIYICGDWRSSTPIHRVMERYFIVQNRITWEREKGRGARKNWKNASEDIWFGTMSSQYVFNLNAVKVKRKVCAPYTHQGLPKDWDDTDSGRFRMTHPSNNWNDLTVPFWSMSENTAHPTQKPEKLLAKIVLASSHEGDLVFDPFLGSGTTSVVSKKLNRHYLGIELEEIYACLAEKRLEAAGSDQTIQGYTDGYFWERNSLAEQNKRRRSQKDIHMKKKIYSIPTRI